MCATIRIGREILCFPCAGFFYRGSANYYKGYHAPVVEIGGPTKCFPTLIALSDVGLCRLQQELIPEQTGLWGYVAESQRYTVDKKNLN